MEVVRTLCAFTSLSPCLLSPEASPEPHWGGLAPPKASSLWQQYFPSASWHLKGRGLLPGPYAKDLMHENHS